MLTHIMARTGQPVLILNGRLLASKVDPEAEAQKWVQQLTPLSQDSQFHFVLGAGSGLALLALANKYPTNRVVVFTTQEEIIKFWNKEYKNELHFQNIEFIHLTSVADFISSSLFFDVIERTFVVHEHPSAVVENSPLFKPLKEALLGRTHSGFCTQAANHLALSSISRILLPTIGALSIKNIADSLKLSVDIDSTTRSEIMLLRELVK